MIITTTGVGILSFDKFPYGMNAIANDLSRHASRSGDEMVADNEEPIIATINVFLNQHL